MIEQKTIDPKTLAPESHMNMEEFASKYMASRDNWATMKKTPAKKLRMTKRNTSTLPSQDGKRLQSALGVSSSNGEEESLGKTSPGGNSGNSKR
jgi:hypothetical protein